MRKPPLKYIIVPLVILLAALCIGGVELAASYFFAPEFFEKTTAPVRRGAQAVIAFCQDTAAFCQDQALELGNEALAFIDRITTPPPKPAPSPEPDISQAVELSEENKRQLMIPRGFGHGFVTLTDEVEFLYKADNYYAPEADGGIRWNDPELNIDWGVEEPILSQKDSSAPWLKDAETGF